MKRILLADRNHDVRSALRLLLETRLSLTVIEEVDTFDDVLASLPLHRPDIILLDSRLPGLYGPASLSAVYARAPKARILLCTVPTEDSAWASPDQIAGFIDKSDPPDELLRTIWRALKPDPE
jgi:DNA-binding NarL/FixJ family response regulator